ncbi:MAG: hypothetical protein ABSC37_17155, partial [Xanthobacteraceae bacterium]
AGLLAANRPSDAIAQYKNEIAIREKLVNKDPKNPTWQAELVRSQQKMKDLQALQDQGAPIPPAQRPSNQNPVSEGKP